MPDGSNVVEIRPAVHLSLVDGPDRRRVLALRKPLDVVPISPEQRVTVSYRGREWPGKGFDPRKRCHSARQVAMATAKKEADCRKAFRCSPPCRCGAGSMIVQNVA